MTGLPCAVQNLLTFVACRLFLPRGALRLPKSVANSLYQILAMVAQQFEGYIFSVNIEEVCLIYAMCLSWLPLGILTSVTISGNTRHTTGTQVSTSASRVMRPSVTVPPSW